MATATSKRLTAVEDSEPNEVEIAKNEVENKIKDVTFHGLVIHLPAKLPAALAFDEMKAQATGEDTGTSLSRTVYKVVGEEQWDKARDHADENDLSVDEFNEFMLAVLRQYYGEVGESSASSDSSESAGA